MKILLITFEYPAGRTYCGGLGQIVKQTREALRGLGHEVSVLISSEFQKRYPVKLLREDNSLVHYHNLWEFQRYYDWHTFDCIYQHFVNWTQDLIRLKKKKRSRPIIVYHFHSILRREKDSGFKTLNHFLINQERMIKIADRIICPSAYEYDNFARYFPCFLDKISLIENTIEVFPPDKERIDAIRSKYNIKKEDTVSVYVGRIEKIKGAGFIIQHLPKILSKHKNHKFFFIGRSLDRNLYKELMSLQKNFSDRFFYLRYLEKEILFQLYYLSDIYVNTSLSESFSLTTHESALCDNALLLNSLPVFSKFRDAALFFSSHDGNGKDFISNYNKLIKNKSLQKRLAKRAKNISADFLSRNRMKQDFLKFFAV